MNERQSIKKIILLFEKVNFSFNVRIFSSIAILLVIPILFAYRFFPYYDTNKFMGFTNIRDFIFFSSMSLAPVIIIIGVFLNAYKISYIPLVFVYSIDLVWLFGAQSFVHYSDVNILYAFLLTVGFVIVYKALSHVKLFQNKLDLEAQEKLDLIQKELDRLEAEDSDE